MRLTVDKAYVAGYTQAIQDLVDRQAVSWKYADLPALAEMIKVAAETKLAIWKEEASVL